MRRSHAPWHHEHSFESLVGWRACALSREKALGVDLNSSSQAPPRWRTPRQRRAEAAPPSTSSLRAAKAPLSPLTVTRLVRAPTSSPTLATRTTLSQCVAPTPMAPDGAHQQQLALPESPPRPRPPNAASAWLHTSLLTRARSRDRPLPRHHTRRQVRAVEGVLSHLASFPSM